MFVIDVVFPAHAGVILLAISFIPETNSFPRTRGGDPKEATCQRETDLFSPHTRG